MEKPWAKWQGLVINHPSWHTPLFAVMVFHAFNINKPTDGFNDSYDLQHGFHCSDIKILISQTYSVALSMYALLK
jgi:hypothetical protein